MNVFDKRFPDRKFSYSTGHTIAPGDWKKVKGAPARGFPKAHKPELIEYLRAIERSTEEWLSARYNSGTLSREDLREHLNNRKRDERKEREEQVEKDDFFQIWRDIIDTARNPKGQLITANAKKDKLQTLRKVAQFSLDTGFVPTLLNINMKFYHTFDRYLREDGLRENSIGKHFKQIKAFLREAANRDYPVCQDYQKKSFKVTKLEVDDVYLTLEEINKILALQIGPGEREITPRQAELRDVFVAACFVGPRHSDWRQIRPENVIVEGGKSFLKIKQQKTGDILHIPLHDHVRSFLNKYHEGCPKIISNQKFNPTIREVCRKALVDETNKSVMVELNGERIEKWTAITTHTARRSLATNLFLAGDLNLYTIRQLTGHRSEASFLRYLKLNGRDTASIAADSKFFKDETWSPLKVA